MTPHQARATSMRLHWLLGLDRFKDWEQFAREPVEVQRDLLLDLVERYNAESMRDMHRLSNVAAQLKKRGIKLRKVTT